MAGEATRLTPVWAMNVSVGIGEQQIRARGIRRTKYDTTFHGNVVCRPRH